MIKNMSKILFLSAFIFPGLAIAAAGDNPTNVASKGYVDSGLVQKANKTDVSTLGTRLGTVETDVVAIQSGKQDKLTAGSNITINAETGVISATPADLTGVATEQSVTDLGARVTTAEGEIDALQTTVTGKADTSSLGALSTLNAVDSTTITDASVAKADMTVEVQASLDKADTALQQDALTGLMQKHNCTSGQMLLAAADGALSCINVENGTYTE